MYRSSHVSFIIASGNQPHCHLRWVNAQKQVIALYSALCHNNEFILYSTVLIWTAPIATSIAWLCFMLGKRPRLELALYSALCQNNEFILYSTVLIWTETSFKSSPKINIKFSNIAAYLYEHVHMCTFYFMRNLENLVIPLPTIGGITPYELELFIIHCFFLDLSIAQQPAYAFAY